MFDETLKLHEKYRLQQFEMEGQIPIYIAELGNRIIQVKYLYDQAKFHWDNVTKTSNIRPSTGIPFRDMQITEIYCESFYYFAWRIMEITKAEGKIKRIKCIAIRDVRNRLIQHPEKETQAKLYPSFGGGGENGPEIKGYIGTENSYNDKGFFINVKEFETKLNEAINELLVT